LGPLFLFVCLCVVVVVVVVLQFLLCLRHCGPVGVVDVVAAAAVVAAAVAFHGDK